MLNKFFSKINKLNLIPELLQRSINIETKVNQLLSIKSDNYPIDDPDQWFGGRTYSQHGEDLLFCNLFKLLKTEIG